MDANNYCRKHQINADDEEWKVLLEELTNPDSEDKRTEPFEGQVCPSCFLNLREKAGVAKRRLKIESRQAIALRTKVDELQGIVDAVVEAVCELTGKDPLKLAKKKYGRRDQSVPGFGPTEQGVLANILPNLIAHAINSGNGSKRGDEGDGSDGSDGSEGEQSAG